MGLGAVEEPPLELALETIARMFEHRPARHVGFRHFPGENAQIEQEPAIFLENTQEPHRVALAALLGADVDSDEGSSASKAGRKDIERNCGKAEANYRAIIN